MKSNWVSVVAVLSLLLFGALPTAFAQNGGRESWSVQLPGISRHFSKPRQAGMRFNETHDGLGMQATRPREDWLVTWSAGVMRDSYDNQSAYAGAAFMRRLRGFDLSVDVGLSPMLLYRSFRFDDWRGDAPMRVFPVVLPTVTLTHRDGLGANLIAIPPGNYGKNLTLPGVVFLQFTQRIN